MGKRKTAQPKKKIYSAISEIAERYHFAPLVEGPNGRLLYKNLVLMSLTYLLNRNHLILGEPGWGKTTGAKVLAARFSGILYDLYDAMEIRGNPQKYEEKIVARPDLGKLAIGREEVVWQGTFGLDVLMIDEVNRLPYDSQDVILQGIDTGRWNYLNRSIFEGKKPTFMTMNERTGHQQNGLLPALMDRSDIITEEGYFSTMIIPELNEARRRVLATLCDQEKSQAIIEALSRGYSDYKGALEERPLKTSLTPEEKKAIQAEVYGMDLANDALMFLQAFMAEINHSEKYGFKRSSDPISDDTHDLHYAGVNVYSSFSPRSAMAALEYAMALAWFMEEKQAKLDHVKFVLPHVFAHKANFTPDYKDEHGNDYRKDSSMLDLAKCLVNQVHERYVNSIQKMKNLIADIQDGKLTQEQLDGIRQENDHPLMKDIIREAEEGERKPFWEE